MHLPFFDNDDDIVASIVVVRGSSSSFRFIAIKPVVLLYQTR